MTSQFITEYTNVMIDVYQLQLGPMDNFVHILANHQDGQAWVVDPAWDAPAIVDLLNQKQLNLTGILLTHGHADHISGVIPLLQQQTVPVYFNQKDRYLTQNMLPSNTHSIEDGDSINFANKIIKVIATPGHTAGSVCFYVDNTLIVGDTLFINGCGRCNFPESDVTAMFHSLQQLKTLPDETLIYCGHNYGNTAIATLAEQKQTNPYLLIDELDFFIAFRMELQAHYRSIPFQPSSMAELNDIKSRHGF